MKTLSSRMASFILLILSINLYSRSSEATSRGGSDLFFFLANYGSGLFEASTVEKHEQWMVQFNRSYSNESEKTTRFEIFKKNLKFIESFNRNAKTTYKLGLNKFADLTHEEFKARYLGLVVPNGVTGTESSVGFRHENVSLSEIGESKDWREEGAVTSIKNQNPCGCCWAFATVAAVEGITKIAKGKLISLSAQQLVDCSKENYGCKGGYLSDALTYIIKNQGITTEDNYPYKAKEGTCIESIAAATISGYQRVPRDNEKALLKAVSQQPVAVAIAGSDPSFMFFSGGEVFNGWYCGSDVDHAVTIVGYGVSEDGVKYWLVKNQWGEEWGENGYMRIKRDVFNPSGACGLATYAYYPTP